MSYIPCHESRKIAPRLATFAAGDSSIGRRSHQKRRSRPNRYRGAVPKQYRLLANQPCEEKNIMQYIESTTLLQKRETREEEEKRERRRDPPLLGLLDVVEIVHSTECVGHRHHHGHLASVQVFLRRGDFLLQLLHRRFMLS